MIGSAVSNRVIKEGHTEKVIYEQRLQRSEEATMQISKEREFQVEGTAKAGGGVDSR